MRKADLPLVARAAVSAIKRWTAPLLERMAALEARPVIGPDEARAWVEAAVKAIPAPKDGASVTLDDVRPLIEEAVKAIPAPKDGRTPTPEEVAAAMELPVARALLDMERRAQDVLRRAAESIPKPKDGLDGLGFDDLGVEHDGERGFTVWFQRGDQVKSFEFSLPVVIDRGFWKEGMTVAKGDGLTFGGSYWIAQKDTDTKPDIGNPDWRLAVKKGRDGKSP